jgi:hypothetical protein
MLFALCLDLVRVRMLCYWLFRNDLPLGYKVIHHRAFACEICR